MALIHFNSWSDMDTVQRQLNRLFDDVVTPTSLETRNKPSIPALELYDTDEAIHIQLELPGIQAENLEIEVTEDTATISGKRQQLATFDEKKPTHSEFRYGNFKRVISLPSLVKNTEVSANYTDGILHLTLPKRDADKNKVVKVTVNSSNV